MKIYRRPIIDELMASYQAHFLPFDLEEDLWTFTDSMRDADVIAVITKYGTSEIQKQIDCIRPYYTNQTIVIISLFHIDTATDIKQSHDYQIELWKQLTDNVVIIHSNRENNNQIFYDILWNRSKCYFTDYTNYNLNERTWTWGTTSNMYTLTAIEKKGELKQFVSPNRIYYDDEKTINHPRILARLQLKKLLDSRNGFISDPQKGLALEPEEAAMVSNILGGQGGTWLPVANRYYNASYVSIYIETITTGTTTKTITEKTWDPLIKGHFILPYGYSGLISDIREYGFILPDWIDYTYDQVDDDTARWEMYTQSVEKVLSKSIPELQQLFDEYKTILEHNRNLFFTRPYDTLHDKIKQFRLTHIAGKNLS